jgi:thiosulfate/3-mercaptopyruvate sulfurtransferase
MTEPTWKYTTPHNIQRVTPQNAECNNCHGNLDLFLTEDDVLPDEVKANETVLVAEPLEPMSA